MKLLFASLLCHRDCDPFIFNWFSSRINLDHGFDIPHLILNDGTLTDEDFQKLEQLPNVYIEKEEVHKYDVPKAVYLAKIECFNIGFNKYNADRVMILDADVFFFKPWDADLRKICMSDSICMRDWCSSLGPHADAFKALFGVHEDITTPNGNTGMFSIPKHQHHKIFPTLQKIVQSKLMVMEDQCVAHVSFRGQLEYVEGIKVLLNGGEHNAEIRKWIESNRGCHLVGMRVRPEGVAWLEDLSRQSWKSLHLSQITPTQKHISWGLMEYGTYSFNALLAKVPSKYNNKYVTDALYIHSGSWIEWKLPLHFKKFTVENIVCMDTGIPSKNAIKINGRDFFEKQSVDIPLNGKLKITTIDSPGGHLAFIKPTLHL